MDNSYIFRREHLNFRRYRAIWERSKAAYSGGAEYIERALIRHVSEVDLEFEERRARACYFNYPRKIARLITQYALAVPPERRGADAELVEDFSRTGLRTNEVICQFSTLLNIYGTAFLAVEMPAFTGEVDPERKKRERLRPYAIALSPLQVPDYAYGEDGLLLWVLIEEEALLNSDPMRPPERRRRRRLWTRTEWRVFEQDPATGKIMLVAGGRHDLGVVPVVAAEEPDGFGIDANHWFEDVVRISDAILNNSSEAQMNIIKQLFGLLVISESFARQANNSKPNENKQNHGERFSRVLARSAAIWESPDEKGVSRYISPGGADTAEIRAENATLKREMFDIVGIAIQRESRDAQTAESKAWDHQNVHQFLACRVELLEQFETECWKLMQRWDRSIHVPEVSYNRDFAVTDLKAAIEGLLGLNQLSGSERYQKLIARAAVGLLDRYQKLPQAERDAALAEIGEVI